MSKSIQLIINIAIWLSWLAFDKLRILKLRDEDRLAFVCVENEPRQIVISSNNEEGEEEGIESDNPQNLQTVKKTISTQLFSNVWLTFMCNVAGVIHFYATFREIATNEMNIQKDDTLFVVTVALCDFFNAFGKLFWSHFSSFKAMGEI